jgi:UDP-N-acetylmuramoyl-L-alanyl-D-glutamate--2,6-diaminopimelate ligase
MNFSQLIKEAREGRPIKTHSGLVEPGDIFIALPGTRLNGASFIPEALKRGASWVISGNDLTTDGLPQEKIFKHKNPALALGELAKAFYHTDSLRLAIIGITGTNGKTTTSYLLEHILRSNGFKTGMIGTVSHRWQEKVYESTMTTPDCLKLHEMLSLMDRDGVEMVIMEVSSHALAQDRVAGIDFDAGVFTNLSQDHLDYHENMEKYFKAKSKLFLSNERKKSFRAVINADDEHGRILLTSFPHAISFGFQESEPIKLRGRLIKNDRTGLTIECEYKNQNWTVSSPISGKHNASNLLAAQGAALSMGLMPEHFVCLETSGQAPGRLQKIVNPRGLDIYVDYAHTPDALENVCLTLKSLDYHRLIVLFGCGGDRDRSKRPLMGRAAALLADVIFLTSDNPRNEDPMVIIQDVKPGLNGCKELHIEPDRRKAIRMAIDCMKPGDALIVAGKGHETYQEVKGVRHPFSDVQEIRKAFEMVSE